MSDPRGTGRTDALREAAGTLLASLAYRVAKCLDGAPRGFGAFRPAADVRSPDEILHHMSDLMDFCRRRIDPDAYAARSEAREGGREPGDARARFDERRTLLARCLEDCPDFGRADPHRLIQGPLADALTHAGQLAMMRRLAGSPVAPESFYRADMSGAFTRGAAPRPPPPAGPGGEAP